MNLVVSLAWVGAVVYAVWRVCRSLDSYIDAVFLREVRRENDRNEANKAAALGKPAPKRAAEITLPDDLYALALGESEAWAQTDQVNLMREKFLELHTGDTSATWQKVRHAMGIGEMPE